MRIRSFGVVLAIVGSLMSTVLSPQASQADQVKVWPGNGHGYLFVSGAVSQQDALIGAGTYQYQGVNGHLVTISSLEENDFVRSISGSGGVWLAAGLATAREFSWLAGPEKDQVFTNCTAIRSCSNISGQFTHWDTTHSQPDFGYWGYEPAVEMEGSGGATISGFWGDCPASAGCAISGYVVEFELPNLHFSSVGTPAISGDPEVGKTLTVDPGTWDSGVNFSYAWYSDGVQIPGASSSRFVVRNDQAGSVITASVTGAKSNYAPETVGSAATGMVTGGVFSGLSKPGFSSTPVADATVSVVLAGWPDQVSLSYQWLVDGVAQPGATGSSFIPKNDYAGKELVVSVTASRKGFTSGTVRSSSSVIGGGTLETLGTPMISGSLLVGALLTANPGVWDPGVGFTYQWFAGGSILQGESSSKLRLQNDWAGTHISVKVTGSKPGFASVSVSSAETDIVSGGSMTLPTPTVSEVFQVGGLASVSTANWPAGLELSYQWYLDSNPIPNLTTPYINVINAYAGKTLSVAVHAKKLGFNTYVSPQLGGTVNGGTIALVGTPSLDGAAVVGQEISIVGGEWPSNAKLSYTWFLDDAPISGQTSDNYTPTNSDAGHSLSARVVVSAPGFHDLVTNVAAPVFITGGVWTEAFGATVSGDYIVGETLFVTPSFEGNPPANASFKCTWFSSGRVISKNSICKWRLTEANRGERVYVSVEMHVPGFEPVTSRVSKSSTVLGRAVKALRSPTLTGSPYPGRTLTVSIGSWPQGTKVNVLWKLDGRVLYSVRGNSFQIPQDALGSKGNHIVTVVITARSAGFAFASTTSLNLKLKKYVAPPVKHCTAAGILAGTC